MWRKAPDGLTDRLALHRPRCTILGAAPALGGERLLALNTRRNQHIIFMRYCLEITAEICGLNSIIETRLVEDYTAYVLNMLEADKSSGRLSH